MLTARRLATLLVPLLPGLMLGGGMTGAGMALPPPEDIPEEVLRTEIVVEGRSARDGEPLTAEEYAAEQAAIAATLDQPGELPPEVQQIVLLLRIRKLVPFVP